MPSDESIPVLCMDEQPVQLIKETRKPIAATKKRAKRVDYEYERNGTASIFLLAEPLSGYRRARARKRRTKIDWAFEVAEELDTRYAGHEQVILVMDNLNTHTKRGVLRSIRAGTGTSAYKANQVLLHPETWQLAECRRVRIELSDKSVPE